MDMSTPDTEWEKEFDKRFGDTFRLCCDDETLSPVIKGHIRNLLTSRDTYWKERVRKKFIPWEKIEILDNGAIMTIDNKVRLYGFKRMTDPLMYEYDLRKGNQALDTLLDNLK